MKIVFFGTSEFAVPSLVSLIGSKHKVLAVVTQPDKKKGRALKLSPSPVKVVAASHGVPVYQPVNASDAVTIEYLKSTGADLFVVISFGQILSKGVLAIPKIFSINIHGSLLPKYRGASPTNRAIISGDSVTGITVMKMSEKLDEGGIILNKEMPIDPEDTNITINEKLSDIGSLALMEAICKIEKDGASIAISEQDPASATYASKLTKSDGLIDWKEPAPDIRNKVRGLLPWPGAYTYYGGKTLKILAADIASDASAGGAIPGEVVDVMKGTGIIVNTGRGLLAIRYLQLEGKKDMSADSFILGHKVTKGYKFGKT